MLMSIDFSFEQSFINFQLDRLTNYFLSVDIKPTVSLQTIGGCRFHARGKRSILRSGLMTSGNGLMWR